MGRSTGWRGSDAGRFAAASGLGALAALLVFVAVLTRGTFDLLEWQRSGNFYDAQATAWLHGTWEIPGGILGIERFESRGQTFMYQGPWPAILRVPAMAVTDRFEGRLTQPSMSLALLVALVATARLHWRVRRQLRPSTPVARADLWVAAAATFIVGAGSALLFEASRAWVYHEAALWGAAWTIAAIDAAVACVNEPSRRRFAWAGVLTTLALWSRSSVGLAGVAALGLLGGGNLLAHLRTRRPSDGLWSRTLARARWLSTIPRANGRWPVAAPMLAATVPLSLYAVVNWIKFHTLFSVPFAGQGFTIADPQRQEFLRFNNGTLFGLKFAPTTLVQYLRPDALRFTSTFPFVDLPPRASGIGGVSFDLIDHSSSVPASMPAVFALALVGLFVITRRARGASGEGLSALRVPVVGALVGAVTIIPFGYIANRYLADAMPALVITGLAGLQHLLGRRSDAGTTVRGRRRWRAGAAALVALALAGVWINVSHALVFQRLHSPNVRDDVIASFLDTQYDVPQSLGLDPAIPLRQDGRLPLDAPRNQIAIVGDCDAMYLSDGMPLNAVKYTPWNPVTRTEAGGRFRRRMTFPLQEPGTRVPIWTMTSDESTGTLFAEWQGGAGVIMAYSGPGESFPTGTLFLPPERSWVVDIVVDPHIDKVQLWLDDELVFEDHYLGPDDGEVHLGVDALGDPTLVDRFPGVMETLPERGRATCEELRAEARG